MLKVQPKHKRYHCHWLQTQQYILLSRNTDKIGYYFHIILRATFKLQRDEIEKYNNNFPLNSNSFYQLIPLGKRS